ncbi:hypothetical protein KQI63_14220 [bacterium]|nr:hypothetical protein [bacterium]
MKLFQIHLLLLLALALLTAGCGGDAATEPKPFFVASSGYLRGMTEPCACPGHPLGGLPRRAHQMTLTMRWPTATMKVDAGNFISLDRNLAKPETELLVAGLMKLDYQAIHVARRDLQIGVDFLQELQTNYLVPFTSASILDAESNKPIFDTHRIVRLKTETGPIDVAVIGVTMGQGRYLPPEWGVAIKAPEKALREELDRLHGKVGAVVLLTDARRREVADWLEKAEAFDEIAAIFSCSISPNRSTYTTVSEVPYTTNGQQGKFFDITELTPGENDRWKMDKNGWPLNDSVEDDPAMMAYLDEMRSKLGIEATADKNKSVGTILKSDGTSWESGK